MYFLHTADRHIGESTSVCKNALEVRHYPVLQRTIQIAHQVKDFYHLDYLPPLIDAGDSFHKRSDTRSEELALMHNFVSYLDDFMDWVIIAGNHDLVSLEPPYSHLTGLGYHERSNRLHRTHIVEFAPRVIQFPHHPKVKVLAIPYGQDLQASLALLDANYEEGDFWIAMAHVCLVGSVVDSGFPMEHGLSGLPNDPRIGYWALGDIHKFQRIEHPQPAFYSGAPCQHNFGDKLPKGILLVNTDDPWNPQLIDLGLPTFLTVDKKDEIPENAGFVRMVVTAEDSTTDLDKRVVQVVPEVSQSSKDLLRSISISSSSFSPLDGLEDYLKGTNLTEDQQTRALKIAQMLSSGATSNLSQLLEA